MNTTNQTDGPSIRCPGCGSAIKLPAESCPNCRYNLRSGTAAAPEPDGEDGNTARPRLLIAGAALVLLIIAVAAGFAFFSSKEEPKVKTQVKQPQAAGTLEDDLKTIENISDQPIGVRPGAIINATQDVADHVNQKYITGDPALEKPEGQ